MSDLSAYVGRWCMSRTTIRQSPLVSDLDVPARIAGTIEDYDGSNDTLLIDFGPRYGIVLVERGEIRVLGVAGITTPQGREHA